MRLGFLLLAGFAVAAVLTVKLATLPAEAQGPVTIVVTDAGDSDTAACPGATGCTLRRAIEAANGLPGNDQATIVFAAPVFPPGNPATIAPRTPLPVVSRGSVAVDAVVTGVVLDGVSLPGAPDGLVLAGPGSAVRGLRVQHFAGACIVLAGDGTRAGGDLMLGHGVRVGGCSVGVAVLGPGASVAGSAIGFAATSDDPSPVGTGVQVSARDVVVGALDGSPSGGNAIGNATTGIGVGTGSGPAFAGVVAGANIIGRSSGGVATPVGTGILISQPSNGTTVLRNLVGNAATGIAVAADVNLVSTTSNRLRANRFGTLAGLAIDLNADGQSNPADVGDADAGANGTLNAPVITRAVQGRVEGTVGPSCAGCSIELYIAAHPGGGAAEYGSEPLPTPLATADAAGSFSFDSPPLSPGEWVTALVTDLRGNTSEFGPSLRVGAGLAQCGNIELARGWTLSGYFGLPQLLGSGVTGDGGKIAAIYHLESDGGYSRWLRDAPSARTLTTLNPGDAYWFSTEAPVTLAGGFSVTAPIPVLLHAGTNDFVYLGGGAAVADALESLGGRFSSLHRYRNDGEATGWESYGAPSFPSWSRDFDAIDPCGTYRISVAENLTLVPLQP